MKITVVYVCPLVGGNPYLDLAARFLESYHKNPAGYPHQSVVVCNGMAPNDETKFMFDVMENCSCMYHDNTGFDIGAYQHAARDHGDCDLMLFFGATAYIRGPGWLARVAESFHKRGNALYGVMGNRGDARVGVYPHIRTTGFWIPPSLFNQYPMQVKDPGERYPFEHGKNCLTSWIKKNGYRSYVVSWSGEYEWNEWDSFPGGFHRGNQEGMLFGDKLSMPPYYHCS